MKKVLMGFLIIVLVLVGGAGFYLNHMLNQVGTHKISQSDENLGIKNSNEESDNITNIALFGLDRRETTGNTRSDTIMIATLDTKNKKAKLTSIMRDTYVNIPSRGMDKINHAYAYGGPELAIRTINENFDMNIRDYVMVDFFGMADIIDALGGVTIDVKPEEVSRTGVSSAGLQTLNGEQAVKYSRIRYVGNGDFERTERQRKVLEQLMNKVVTAGPMEYPKLMNQLLPYVETSLSKREILKLGTSAFTSGVDSLEEYRIPVDGYAKGQKMNGIYYLVPQDLQTNVEFLHEFIYEDSKPVAQGE
ncbi:LCP family protein [Garciella nitratireducens]|uniref:Transcriptional attenuator, LytR family n=1 Tax=Garciella nitratireducens DSM 15102 TaxID=1121911 RepID=A0A1T4P857_9FIRM|nr:LCP family protein [Garciella nitratireducens]SJZ87684.1 transcriptional attenuator, LytR family [Garciella nitratireducens DSM 15102]